MPRVVHFEMAVDDPDRASRFYESVFGWKVQKWDGPQDYWMVTTGEEGELGINGGLMRRGDFPSVMNTVDVASVNDAAAKVERSGGQVSVPKMAVPGIGWLAYCQDTEGNTFGIMQADPSAG
jgi:predicted enzyme related to lactoylglutathione lyase